MDVIFKYKLKFNGLTPLTLPLGAVSVFVAMQGGEPHLWVRQSETAKSSKNHAFCIVGTGIPFSARDAHVGTIQDGAYIWHVFEVVP